MLLLLLSWLQLSAYLLKFSILLSIFLFTIHFNKNFYLLLKNKKQRFEVLKHKFKIKYICRDILHT